MSYGDLLGDVEAQSEPGSRTFRKLLTTTTKRIEHQRKFVGRNRITLILNFDPSAHRRVQTDRDSDRGVYRT